MIQNISGFAKAVAETQGDGQCLGAHVKLSYLFVFT